MQMNREVLGMLRRTTRVVLPAAILIASSGFAVAAAPPIVIGGTVSETGAFAEDAGYQVKGMQLAIADANAKGGWIGRKIDLKI